MDNEQIHGSLKPALFALHADGLHIPFKRKQAGKLD